MQATNFIPGMIYLVKNQFEEKIGLQTTQHNYIVLGTINRESSGFQMVQAMTITSNPRNEGKTGKAVPVLLSNGAISWILPYNIHSIPFCDIEKGKFHGIINDSEYFSTKRFIQMLVDLYNDELGLGFIDHDVIMDEYNDYCNWFFDVHSGLKQYRELDNTVKAPSLFDAGKPTVYRESTKKLLKPQKYREIDEIKGEKIIPDINPEIEKTGPEYETVYSDEPGKPIATKIIVPELNFDKRRKYKDKTKMTEADKKAIQSFVGFPNFVKDWKDNEILLFAMAFDTYGAKTIASMTDRWSSMQSVRYTYGAVKKQAQERKLVLN